MRVPILIAFMLVAGIAVVALSALAGIGFGGIVLRLIATVIFVQFVYFGALIARAALSGRRRDASRDSPSAPLKHRSPR